MTTMIDTVTDENGKTTTHTFVSDLPEIVPLIEWLKTNKTESDLTIWQNASDTVHTSASLALYKEWLTAYHIVHTVSHHDGSEEKNDHTTYQFE